MAESRSRAASPSRAAPPVRPVAPSDPAAKTAPVSEPPGWLTQFRRGTIAGFSIPIIGLIIVAVPVMAAWIVPGSDSVSASSALRAAGIAVVAGLRGGVVLGGLLTTVAPVVVSLLLGWLLWGPARRMESTSGFVGLCTGFTVCAAVIARACRLGDTYAPVGRTALAGVVFSVLLGSTARWAPIWWSRLNSPSRRIARAAAAVSLVYLSSGAFLVTAMLVLHHGEVTALQERVAPGLGGLAVLLLGIAVAPVVAIAGAGYLTGSTVTVGTQTSVSVTSVSRGRLPEFPVLASLPHPSGLSVTGLVLIVLVATASGIITVGVITPSGWRGAGEVLAASALVGVAFLLAGTAIRGGLGAGGLRGIGVIGWQFGAGGAAATAFSGLAATAVRLLLCADRAAHKAEVRPARNFTLLTAEPAEPAAPLARAKSTIEDAESDVATSGPAKASPEQSDADREAAACDDSSAGQSDSESPVVLVKRMRDTG